MSSPASAYDLVLVGGGLASSLIAWRLRIDRPDISIAVVERDARLGGNHTWSFFDSDLEDADRAWLAPAIAHRWDGYDVFFPGLSRSFDTAYNSLTGERLDASVRTLLGDGFIQGEAAEVRRDSVRLTDGRVVAGRGVMDARGPGPAPMLDLAFQSFVGRTLRLAQPHGLDRPTIMDATVWQGQDYRFVYLLPLDRRRVLVEDTYYTDAPGLDREAIRRRIDAYVRSRGWTVEAVEGEEEGVLPIALGGDVDAFWTAGPPVARAGLAAALFHPTTGYSLPDAVALARAVAAAPDLSSAALRALTEARSKSLWRQRRFYRLLNRMLFRAADPGLRWKVLRRFHRLDEGLVRRFYAGRTTPLDKLRILTGKPPVPVTRAMRQLRDRAQGAVA